MKFIGISGFENSIPFKKKHWPGLNEREYRMSQGHDSAAALLIDGVLVAAVNRPETHPAKAARRAVEHILDEARP